MSAQYPIRAVAKMTGIPIDTLRAWERRYNAVTPGRTDRGRAYDDAQVRRLTLLRRVVDAGHAIGQVAMLPDEELERLAEPPQINSAPWPGDPTLERLLGAIEAFDYNAANEELGRLAILLNPTDLVHRAILPAMRITGERWERGRFTVAQEHMLSSCVRNLLGGLVRVKRPDDIAPTLLFTTPAGELHEFGILAAAMLAAGQGLQVVYLGPNLPAREILFAAEQSKPAAVVLGILKPNATAAVREDLRLMATELPPNVELWAGGSGAMEVTPDGRGRAYVLKDLADFVRHLIRLKSARVGSNL